MPLLSMPHTRRRSRHYPARNRGGGARRGGLGAHEVLAHHINVFMAHPLCIYCASILYIHIYCHVSRLTAQIPHSEGFGRNREPPVLQHVPHLPSAARIALPPVRQLRRGLRPPLPVDRQLRWRPQLPVRRAFRCDVSCSYFFPTLFFFLSTGHVFLSFFSQSIV